MEKVTDRSDTFPFEAGKERKGDGGHHCGFFIGQTKGSLLILRPGRSRMMGFAGGRGPDPG